MHRGLPISIVALAVVLAGLVARPAWAAPPLPSSMAALGDSITRAADVCCWYGDHPGQSWSTGYTRYDGISSHYERIKQANPAITGHAYNDAVSGAKMDDAPGQASQAVSQHPQYVTIEMGANDLCTSSPDTMTDPKAFEDDFRSTLDTLMGQTPRPYVFVASIPDIYRLQQVLHDNSLARWVWATAHICQSMLGATRTEAERQLVVQRETALNAILATVCAEYARCLWDGGAVYDYKFSASKVSTLDYFHPSLSGQATLASVTRAKSWWGP